MPTRSSGLPRASSARASTRSPRRSSRPPPSAASRHPTAEHFEAVAGHGALATVEGHAIAIGNARLLEREQIPLDGLAHDAAALADEGRTIVTVAIDGHAAGLLAIADEPRPTARQAVAALKQLGIRPVMLTGDNAATAKRIAADVGIDEVIADVLPADKAAKVAELQQAGRHVAMVGDGVNDAPALAAADVGIAIGAGTDVAIETADIVLMRSDPLDIATAIAIGRGTLSKMRQNLAWAVGYNTLALPLAAGLLEPIGLTLRPEIAAISMSGSSILVALNAVALKRLPLPDADANGLGMTSAEAPAGPPQPSRLRGVWNAVVGAIATIVGLAPHVLHHIGLLAGVAIVTGTGGTILFGLVGLAASIPLLVRLKRRFHTWRAPAIALVVFAAMFSLSSFVIGPAISDDGGGPHHPRRPEQRHQPEP